MKRSFSFYIDGKQNVQCRCGYIGKTINSVCKKCKRMPDHNLKGDEEKEIILKKTEKWEEGKHIISLQIGKVTRKNRKVRLEEDFKRVNLMFDSVTGEVEMDCLIGHLISCREELFDIFNDWFLKRDIQYVDLKEILKARTGIHHCLCLLKFPVLQNSPFQSFYEIPEVFHEKLFMAECGDDIWDTFIGHHSKKIKEVIKRVEDFNYAMFFGPFIKRSENLFNLLTFLLENEFSPWWADVPYVAKLYKDTNITEFNRGMKLIQNLHLDETVWVNKMILFVKKNNVISTERFIEYIIDIGRSYHLGQWMIDDSHFKRISDVETLHDYLARCARKAKTVNQYIHYSIGEKEIEMKDHGYSFKLARDTHELIDVGEALDICVGSYGNAAVSKELTIVLLYKKDEDIPIVCIELNDDFVVQAKMKYNQTPSEELKTIIHNWAKEKDLMISTTDLLIKEAV